DAAAAAAPMPNPVASATPAAAATTALKLIFMPFSPPPLSRSSEFPVSRPSDDGGVMRGREHGLLEVRLAAVVADVAQCRGHAVALQRVPGASRCIAAAVAMRGSVGPGMPAHLVQPVVRAEVDGVWSHLRASPRPGEWTSRVDCSQAEPGCKR